MKQAFCLILLITLVFSLNSKTKLYSRENPSETFKANDFAKYTIIGKYPRSSNLRFFTEGLSFVDENTLLESTGLYGDSEIHFIQNVEKGEDSSLPKRHQFSKEYFGEGSVKVEGENGIEYYMLTYKERKVFVLDQNLENVVRTFEIPNDIEEGWGMTQYKNQNGEVRLLVSDGSNRLFHIDPKDFSIKATVKVNFANGEPLTQINELEMYKGASVLANIWNTNLVAKIDVTDGQLLQMYDFTGLVEDLESEDEYKNLVDPFFGSVLNGIAYHKGTKRLIMGGKKWPYWYEVELTEEQA